MFLVRVESRSDPTSSPPWFAVVNPDDGRTIRNADWREGCWMTPYDDGYAVAGIAGLLPRAGFEVVVKVEWYPLRLVPGFPALG